MLDIFRTHFVHISHIFAIHIFLESPTDASPLSHIHSSPNISFYLSTGGRVPTIEYCSIAIFKGGQVYRLHFYSCPLFKHRLCFSLLALRIILPNIFPLFFSYLLSFIWPLSMFHSLSFSYLSLALVFTLSLLSLQFTLCSFIVFFIFLYLSGIFFLFIYLLHFIFSLYMFYSATPPSFFHLV